MKWLKCFTPICENQYIEVKTSLLFLPRAISRGIIDAGIMLNTTQIVQTQKRDYIPLICPLDQYCLWDYCQFIPNFKIRVDNDHWRRWIRNESITFWSFWFLFHYLHIHIYGIYSDFHQFTLMRHITSGEHYWFWTVWDHKSQPWMVILAHMITPTLGNFSWQVY